MGRLLNRKLDEQIDEKTSKINKNNLELWN